MPGFPSAPVNTPSAAEVHADAPHPSAPARLGWARLLKRVFDIDIEQCPQWGGTLTILAAFEDPPVIAQILTHLGLPAGHRPDRPRGHSIDSKGPDPRPRPPTSRLNSPSRQPPLAGTRATPKRPRSRAPRTAEGPETSRILDRRITSLTTRGYIRTLPLAEKGRLKFLYLGRFKCSSYIAHSEHGRDRGKPLVIYKLLDFTHG